MKTKLLLALIAIIAAVVILTLWRPASPTSAPSPVSEKRTDTTIVSTAASQTEQQRVKKVVARPQPMATSPIVQVSPQYTAAELLARIQEALASTNPADHEIVFTNLLAALVRLEPLTAAQFAETNQLVDIHDPILHCVARLWAAQDTTAALNWATTLNNTNGRDAVLTDVCLQIAGQDPADAVATRSEYLTDGQPNAGLEALAQRWAETDFPAALDWALSRDSGDQRNQIIARLAFVESQTDPIDAGTLVVEKIPAGPVQTEAIMAVLHQWALRDFPAAQHWVEQFPTGDVRTRAINELAGIEKYQSSLHSP